MKQIILVSLFLLEITQAARKRYCKGKDGGKYKQGQGYISFPECTTAICSGKCVEYICILSKQTTLSKDGKKRRNLKMVTKKYPSCGLSAKVNMLEARLDSFEEKMKAMESSQEDIYQSISDDMMGLMENKCEVSTCTANSNAIQELYKTPWPATEVTPVPEGLPKYVSVDTNGPSSLKQSHKMGVYILQNEYTNQFPKWKQDEGQHYLYVTTNNKWCIGPDYTIDDCGIINTNKNPTSLSPVNINDGWLYWDSEWKEDNKIRVEKVTNYVSSCTTPMTSTYLPPLTGCSIGEEYEANCYINVESHKTWFDAEIDCNNRKGTLASIYNILANNFLANVAEDSLSWIGASDRDTEGVWKWTNGDIVNFTNWYPGKLDNADRSNNCAAINWIEPAKWDDRSCDNVLPYICQLKHLSEGCDTRMRIGTEVVRNDDDWPWGCQDGGAGSRGTVTSLTGPSDGWIQVMWEREHENYYRWGLQGKAEIKIFCRDDCSTVMRVGTKVVRDEDFWEYGDQDGGPGSIGRITGMHDNHIFVQWEINNYHDSYRWSIDGKTDVKVYCQVDEASTTTTSTTDAVDICLENDCFEADKFAYGGVQVGSLASSPTQLSCATACLAIPACKFWNMIVFSGYCMLFDSAPTIVPSPGMWLGAATCDPAGSPLCKSAGCCAPSTESTTPPRSGGDTGGPFVSGTDGGYWPGRPFIVNGKSLTTNSEMEALDIDKDDDINSWRTVLAPLPSPSRKHTQEIGEYWLKQAEAEHASVASFARHTLQLMKVGAPARLLEAVQNAALDEIKHAKMCYGVASEVLGKRMGPGSLDVGGSLENMELKEIVKSVIVEGCFGETLSAIEAHLAAHYAEDRVVKDVLKEIAEDETRHGQLALDTIEWVVESKPYVRDYVNQVFAAQLKLTILSQNYAGLNNTQLCEQSEKEMTLNKFGLLKENEESEKDIALHKYGLLNEDDRSKVRAKGILHVIEPVYREGFKHVNSISKRIIELNMSYL